MTIDEGCKFTTDYARCVLFSKQKKALHNGRAAKEVSNMQRAVIYRACATSFDV